jgi:hypothetical protein
MRSSTAVTAPARVPNSQTAGSIGKVIGGMTVQLRERIMAEALRQVGTCGEYEISRVVSKNLGVQEKIVDAVVMASYLAERSRRAALETGLRGAVEMAVEADRAVWREIAGVA